MTSAQKYRANACELAQCAAKVSTAVGKGLGAWQAPHGRMDRQVGGHFVCGVPGALGRRGGTWWGCRELGDVPGELWWGAADYTVSPSPISFLRRIAISEQLNLGEGNCASRCPLARSHGPGEDAVVLP